MRRGRALWMATLALACADDSGTAGDASGDATGQSSSSMTSTATEATAATASASTAGTGMTAGTTSGTASGSGSTTAPVDPPEPGTFTALTYNVAGLPQGISGSNPETNTPQMSPLLNAYDLVLVQEDFWYHADLVSQVQHEYRSVPWPEELRSMIGDGLNRFANFPFEPVERVTWYDCHGQIDCSNDCLAKKGWSFARTTVVEGAQIDIYNIHMEAGGCDQDIVIRQQSAMDLVAAIMERSADRPVIVAGDFNLRYTDAEDLGPLATIVDGPPLRDVCDELECGAHDIDHFMIRDGANLRLEPVRWWEAEEFVDESTGDPLSDHPAVAVELRYAPK